MKNILIYGDGIIGKLTAIALSRYFDIYILSGQNNISPKNKQERYFSINLLSKFMLERYKIWDHLNSKELNGYNKIITWNESFDENVTFDSSEISFDKLGYIIRESDIKESLNSQLSYKNNIFTLSPKDIDKTLDLNPEFIIKSDQLKEKLNFEKINYSQKAIVLDLTIDKNINTNIAYQRFDFEQIQGLLPISNNEYNLIWSAKDSHIDSLSKYDDSQMLSVLNKYFRDKIGNITQISSRSVFPLSGFNSKKYIMNDTILIGGAAHSVHPMAGLGLNMGIQDIFSLITSIEKEDSTLKALKNYEKVCYTSNSRFFNTINLLIEFYTGGKIPDIIRSKSLLLFNKNKFLKNKIIEVATGIDALKSKSKDEYCKPSYK